MENISEPKNLEVDMDAISDKEFRTLKALEIHIERHLRSQFRYVRIIFQILIFPRAVYSPRRLTKPSSKIKLDYANENIKFKTLGAPHL